MSQNAYIGTHQSQKRDSTVPKLGFWVTESLMNGTENQENWGLINLDTGEVTEIDRVDSSPGRWEKVWSKTLANMLDTTGDQQTKVIATLIRRRDMANFVNLTTEEIAEKAKVSRKTVTRTLKALEDKNFIHRIRNGKLMFSPHVMRRGETSQGLAVVTMWEQENES